jgi:hypothetical protein
MPASKFQIQPSFLVTACPVKNSVNAGVAGQSFLTKKIAGIASDLVPKL